MVVTLVHLHFLSSGYVFPTLIDGFDFEPLYCSIALDVIILIWEFCINLLLKPV